MIGIEYVGMVQTTHTIGDSTMGMITREVDIKRYSLYVIKVRYGLELRGMKSRGQTMYSLVKERYGFRGNRQSVYDQFCGYIQIWEFGNGYDF